MTWPCWDSALPTSPGLLLDNSFRSKSDLCKTSLNGFGSVLPPALPFHNAAFHPCCIRSFFLALRWCLVYLPLFDLPSQLFLRFSEPGSHCPFCHRADHLSSWRAGAFLYSHKSPAGSSPLAAGNREPETCSWASGLPPMGALGLLSFCVLCQLSLCCLC